MEKIFKTNFLMVILALVYPCVILAQRGEDLPGGDIEPPPAPIDGSIVYLAVAALLLAVYYFYRVNIKIITK